MPSNRLLNGFNKLGEEEKKSGNREIEDIIYFKIKDERFRKYYNFYGTKGCSARNYQEGNLEESMT